MKPYRPPHAFRLRPRTHWLVPAVASLQTTAQALAALSRQQWFEVGLWLATSLLMGLFVAKLEMVKAGPPAWRPR